MLQSYTTPTQGYHLILTLSCIMIFCSIKPLLLIHQNAFVYLIFRGQIGVVMEETTAAAGGEREKRKEKLKTPLLDCCHQQTVFSSTDKPTTLLGTVHANNFSLREAEAVGMGSKSTWAAKRDHLRKQQQILFPLNLSNYSVVV